jgi:GDP-L-fucose synthase
MKILVTGSTGLVGTAIQRVSKKLFPEYSMVFISSKDCDLLDLEQTKNTFRKHSPNCVLHLAANVGGLYKNMNQKVQMFESNLIMNYNVIKACYHNNIQQLIGMLSTCIFPDAIEYPIDETKLTLGPPHVSNDAYAYAKRMFKVHCDAYNDQYNTNYNCVIPANIYGINDNYNLDDAHVIPALIHKCYLAKKANKKFEVLGTGKPLRQFVYSDDLAEIILRLLPTLDQDSVIITNPKEYKIKDVATCIAKAFDYEEAIRFRPTASDGQYRKQASVEHMLKLLQTDTFEFTTLSDGINTTVEHFCENYKNLRI